MNERELDRAIDAAADAMMSRQPSRSLGYAVMARVREADDAPAPRRRVWLIAAASLVVCAAIAMTLFSRTHPASVPLPRASALRVGQPALIPSAPVTIVSAVTPARRYSREPQTESSVAPRPPLPLSDPSPIEPIQTDPIVLTSVDVPQLEREATAIDPLSVEPLTIEPLATSND